MNYRILRDYFLADHSAAALAYSHEAGAAQI